MDKKALEEYTNRVLEEVAQEIERRRDQSWPDGPTYPHHYTECAGIVREFKKGYEAHIDQIAGLTELPRRD